MDTDDRAELAPALCELAAAFTALVEVLLDNGHAQLTPQRIVDIAARVMPGCRHAAVVIVDHHRPHTLASTDAIPDHVDAVQFDTGEGPSLDVLTTDDYLRADDLTDDPRWSGGTTAPLAAPTPTRPRRSAGCLVTLGLEAA